MVKRMGATLVKVFSDCQLVVSQMQGTYLAKDLTMGANMKKMKELMVNFEIANLQQLLKKKE